MSGSMLEQLKMFLALNDELGLPSIFREPRGYEGNHNNL